MEIVYTFMGRLDRHDLERLGNCLELTLVETAEVSFAFSGRNRHSFSRIFLVINERSGNNFIHNHTAHKHLRMHENMIYFMPGNTDLEFCFNPDMRFISFHFHLELFGHFDIFSGQTSCACIEDKTGIIRELSAIINAPGCDWGTLCRMRGIVTLLAGGFIDRQPAGMEKLNFLSGKYSAMFEYIRNQADARTSIDDLATIAKMTRDSLSREFSRNCDITLKQYLNRNLIQQAEKLLLEPEATARKVAERLNFNNEYYFSRFFKKNTGTTTGDYRARMQLNPK